MKVLDFLAVWLTLACIAAPIVGNHLRRLRERLEAVADTDPVFPSVHE